MPLSFAEILTESIGFFFARFRLFFHLVTIPWILSLALRIATAMIGEQSLAMVLVEKAADVIPTTMFMVAWMRVVLLGPARVEHVPGLGWSRRETAFLIHLLKVAGITFALLMAFTLMIGSVDPVVFGRGPIDPETVRRQGMAAPVGTAFIVSAILALRVSFGLAATAVDVAWSPRRSWAYGRGNTWTILSSLFVILFAGAIATSLAILLPLSLLSRFELDLAPAIITWTLAILVSYAGAAVLATAQAVIFRRLTQWREGVPLA